MEGEMEARTEKFGVWTGARKRPGPARILNLVLLGARFGGEHVARRADGQQVLRMGGIGFKLLAEAMNVDAHDGACGMFGGVITVHGFDEIAAADDALDMLHEID